MYIVSDESINQQEAKGRAPFIQIFSGITWYECQDKYEVVDLTGNTSNSANAIVKDTDQDIYIEAKARQIKSNDFLSTFLECKKYIHLMQLANQTANGKAFYFVTFTDNVAYLFDLKNIAVEKYRTKRLMKEVSMEGQTIQILKDVYELPLDRKMKGVTRYRW
jgi:hypothetical protein